MGRAGCRLAQPRRAPAQHRVGRIRPAPRGAEGPAGVWRASSWSAITPHALRGWDLGTCHPWHCRSRVPLLPLLATATSCPFPSLPPPGPTSSSLSRCSSSPPSSQTVLAPTFPPAHLFPFRTERGQAGVGTAGASGTTGRGSRPSPTLPAPGNPSLQPGGRGDSTQRVKAAGGRGWARSWAAPLKEGAGAGNSHPTCPPPLPSCSPQGPRGVAGRDPQRSGE